MRNIFVTIGSWIRGIIDFFYPPFKKYMTIQFFRYGVSGLANVIFDWVLFFLVFHFVVHQQIVYLGIFPLKPYNAALFITFPVTFLSGFLLQKYVTFSTSELRGHVQLFRYFVVLIANLLLNYLGLKLLVDTLHVFPTPAKMIVTIFTTLFSYFSQKKYTFKKIDPTHQRA